MQFKRRRQAAFVLLRFLGRPFGGVVIGHGRTALEPLSGVLRLWHEEALLTRLLGDPRGVLPAIHQEI